MAKSNFSLSIVLPAHNEAENIKNTVSNCVSYVEGKFSGYEVIVVNDGSGDSTPEIVTEMSSANPNIVLVNHAVNQGYGAALKSGFNAATRDYIFFMDSDGQFNINDLDNMVPKIREKIVVIGYREDRADSFIRSMNAWMYGMYIRLMFGLDVKDMDCAFKIFPRDAYNEIKPIKAGGALFTAEFLIKLKRIGYTLKEVPVRHFPRQFGTQSGANINVILRMFKESWKLRDELKRG